MAKFNVADKPTLDEVYNLVNNNSGSGGLYIGNEFNIENVDMTIPYDFYHGCAVVYNDEIHILGSAANTAPAIYSQRHYKYDGNTNKWTPVSQIPFPFYRGSAVVFNNEIHILGGNGGNKYHYKYNGVDWISVSTLPYVFLDGDAIVWNGQLHIYGSSNSNAYKMHYVFNEDTSTWTRLTNMPFNFYNGYVVEYKGDVYALGGQGSNKGFQKCTGLTWSAITDSAGTAITLPFAFLNGQALVQDGKIHLLGSSSAAATYIQHFTWDGTKWTEEANLPYNFYHASAVSYRGEIHLLGGQQAATLYRRHYRLDKNKGWLKVIDIYDLPCRFEDGVSASFIFNDEMHILNIESNNHYKHNGILWERASIFPYEVAKAFPWSAVTYNNEIHIFGKFIENEAFSDFSHYKYTMNGGWVKEKVSLLPQDYDYFSTVVYNNEIHLLGYSGLVLNNKHYKYNGISWKEVDTMPFDFYYGGAVVYNDEIHLIGGSLHYKYDGLSWSEDISIPDQFVEECLITNYNDSIYLISKNTLMYYIYNNGSWSIFESQNLPVNGGQASSIIVYKNELNLLGGVSADYFNFRRFVYKDNEWEEILKPTHYIKYFLPEKSLITFNDNNKNNNVYGNILYKEDLNLYEVQSDGEIMIEFLNEEGKIYTIS